MARIAFLQDVMVEFMGYMHMSAVLKGAGHEVEVFIDDGFSSDRFYRDIRRFAPDIAGFSVLSPTLPWALKTARSVQADTGAITVFGNVHAIIEPEIISEPGVDVVCRSEGEAPLLELANRIAAGTPHTDIPGLWVKTAGRVTRNDDPEQLQDIDALPPHDRTMYDKYPFFRDSRYLRFLLGRGCPHRCAYCSNDYLVSRYGPGYVRKRSPEAAVAELERIVASRRTENIYFVDEVLWLKSDWLHEFLNLYRDRVGVPFSANFRYGNTSEEDVAMLAEAGCRQMILAVECADEKKRLLLLKKRVADEKILEAARLLHKFGIKINANVLFGLPGDTVRDHMRRLSFFREMKPDYLWTAFFQPYPGLKLSESPEVKKLAPTGVTFGQTFHHEMPLVIPDRRRMENLKKIYFLMLRFPRLEPLLLRISKWRFPLLFDALFLAHFTYYIFEFEHVSFRQYLHHVKTFALKPLFRK